MSKKVFTAAELVFLVILLSLVVPFTSEANANPLGWFHSEMTISLLSPQNGFHYDLLILVNFTSQSNLINLAERAVNADGSLASALIAIAVGLIAVAVLGLLVVLAKRRGKK